MFLRWLRRWTAFDGFAASFSKKEEFCRVAVGQYAMPCALLITWSPVEDGAMRFVEDDQVEESRRKMFVANAPCVCRVAT
jgi:hypothetical protein